jgi:hypothetical protein
MLDDTTMAFGWAPNDAGERRGEAVIATSEEAPTGGEVPVYNINETPSVPMFYTVPSDAVRDQTVVPPPASPPGQ